MKNDKSKNKTAPAAGPGKTNAMGLAINSANPLSTLNGGIGTSHTYTQGSVIFSGSASNFTENNSQLSWNNSTNKLSVNAVNVTSLTASQAVATDASNNLISTPLPLGITAIATITTSTQTMSIQTRYINNYTVGQMTGTLPTATGSGKTIEIVGLSTASTSGWKVSAQSTDKIQFGSTLGATAGSLTSTTLSATDCATFIDAEANLWVVYNVTGLNLTVA